MNGMTSSRSRSDTPPIAFGFPPRTRNALPRLHANGTGLRFALGVQPPDDVARPDHDVGAHPQRQVAQAQLAGLQQRQVNARGVVV